MASSSTGASGNYPDNTSRLAPRRETFSEFLCNRSAGTFLGRTGGSWAKIGLFYLVFYLFLAGWFALLFWVFYQTISLDQPSHVGKASILTKPGVGVRPFFDLEDKKYQVKYDIGDTETTDNYVKHINDLLEPYKKQPDSTYRDCPWNAVETNTTEPCKFDLASFNSTCGPENRWGYNTYSPCFVLKMNKMISFIPNPITNITNLPTDLQATVRKMGSNVDEILKKHVWVWCSGGEDKGVEFEQFNPGLPIVYYPYTNQPNYRSPLVLVRMKFPDATLVKVTCKILANNVPFKADTRLTGMADFMVRLTNTTVKAKKSEL